MNSTSRLAKVLTNVLGDLDGMVLVTHFAIKARDHVDLGLGGDPLTLDLISHHANRLAARADENAPNLLLYTHACENLRHV